MKFIPFDINYKVVDNKPCIFLYGRSDNNQICIVDDSFRPYFYVILNKDEDINSFIEKINKITVDVDDRQVKIKNTDIVDKKLFGKSVKTVKITTNLPQDIPIIREVLKDWDLIKSIYEYDIPFIRRYLVDKNITPLTTLDVEVTPFIYNTKVPSFKASKITNFNSDSINPKIFAFDIETYNPLGKRFLPEQHPIIMLALYGKDYKKVITWKRFKTDEDYIEFVDGELELLERFKEIITKHKPDILAGYYSDGFDLPYMITRAKKYKLDLDLNLDHSPIPFTKGRSKSVQLTGILHFDVFKFVSKILGRSLDTDSFSLDNVAFELLNENKNDVDLNQLAPAWDNKSPELESFCKYNLQDAILTYRLAQKLLPNIEELVKIVQLPFFEVNRSAFSQLVENYIFCQVQSFNELAPNRPSYHQSTNRRNESYQGAFVFEPSPGLYNKVVVFDFRSLYPTIIASHNLCLSTLHCNCCKNNKIPDHDYWFCKKKKGFLPQIIESLITRRMRVKEIMKEKSGDILLAARSQSLKLLANSFYGYLGFSAARWYCIECARSTTALARHYITSVIDKAKSENFQILYSDTDSIFLALNDKSKQEAIHFVEKINQDLPGLMELEYEGYYPSALFVSAKGGSHGAKKKYALLKEDGSLKITGFETIRKNISTIAKEVQENVLNLILSDKDIDGAVKYVKKIISDLKEKKISKEQVILRTQLSKEIEDYTSIGPHVAIAKKMKLQGEDVGPGSIINYIIAEGPGIIREKAKLPNEITNNYDSDYYINNQIIPAVDKIFEVLNIDKEELLSKNQSKLSNFFS